MGVVKKMIFICLILVEYLVSAHQPAHSGKDDEYTAIEFPEKIPSRSSFKKPTMRVTNAFKKKEMECRIKCDAKLEEEMSPSATICVQTCTSPECYQVIYASYVLEEGEVDQRADSFKSCVYREIAKAFGGEKTTSVGSALRTDWIAFSACSIIFALFYVVT